MVLVAWEAGGGIPALCRGWDRDPAMAIPWPILVRDVTLPKDGTGAIPTATGATDGRGAGSMLTEDTDVKEGLVPMMGLALIWFNVKG